MYNSFYSINIAFIGLLTNWMQYIVVHKLCPPPMSAMLGRAVAVMYVLIVCANVSLVCMRVFVYVCIWFTHQSSGVMSLTRWEAHHGEATCVMAFRPLLESYDTLGKVSGWARTPEGSGGVTGQLSETRWHHNRSLDSLETDSVYQGKQANRRQQTLNGLNTPPVGQQTWVGC